MADEIASQTKKVQLDQLLAEMFGGNWVEVAEEAEEDLANWNKVKEKYCGGARGLGTGLGEALRTGACWVGGNRGQGGPACNL